jgi:predicted GNAT family acetyltransferase
MALSNFERMIQLSDEVFSSRTDPDQLNVNEDVMDHLQRIHPDTISEFDDGNGPVCWILCIPTTLDLMTQFIDKKISERELYELTPLNTSYEAIYLCSAMLLEEFRGKGIAQNLCLNAIQSIKKDHEIKDLFFWSFSNEGEKLANKVSELTGLPLHKRQ